MRSNLQTYWCIKQIVILKSEISKVCETSSDSTPNSGFIWAGLEGWHILDLGCNVRMRDLMQNDEICNSREYCRSDYCVLTSR